MILLMFKCLKNQHLGKGRDASLPKESKTIKHLNTVFMKIKRYFHAISIIHTRVHVSKILLEAEGKEYVNSPDKGNLMFMKKKVDALI